MKIQSQQPIGLRTSDRRITRTACDTFWCVERHVNNNVEPKFAPAILEKR